MILEKVILQGIGNKYTENNLQEIRKKKSTIKVLKAKKELQTSSKKAV